MINKPIVIAICGKSASGKTTLADELNLLLPEYDVPVHYLVSDTTRPRRAGEISGKDYYFISRNHFLKNRSDLRYAEWSQFRHWYYGTRKNEIKSNVVNIGVFNISGLRRLASKGEYDIIPVYVADNFITRIKRSIKREGKFRFEFIRRAIADHYEFKGIESFLHSFNSFVDLKKIPALYMRSKLVINHILSKMQNYTGQSYIS